jgi:hypothetical protein
MCSLMAPVKWRRAAGDGFAFGVANPPSSSSPSSSSSFPSSFPSFLGVARRRCPFAFLYLGIRARICAHPGGGGGGHWKPKDLLPTPKWRRRRRMERKRKGEEERHKDAQENGMEWGKGFFREVEWTNKEGNKLRKEESRIFKKLN